jgi:hypothetical protein
VLAMDVISIEDKEAVKLSVRGGRRYRLNSGNKSSSAETCTNVAWRPQRGLER